MERYIDAVALKERMLNYYDCVNDTTCKGNYRGETLMDYEVADMIEDCIDNAPTADVVAVVRCGECKRWKADGGYGLDLDGTKRLYGVCAITNMAYKENHFCNFGAKRNEEK